jgi:hypothetical protein
MAVDDMGLDREDGDWPGKAHSSHDLNIMARCGSSFLPEARRENKTGDRQDQSNLT